MPSDTVNQMVEQLREQETRLLDELTEARNQAARIEDELGRIRTARETLSGKGRGGKRRRRSTSGHSLTTSELVAMIADRLNAETATPEDALRADIDRAVRASGRSRTGLHLRFPEALRHKRFRQEADGWRLVSGVQPDG